MAKKPAPERLTLKFDLLDLPTAQHRAGLAGLVLQIDSMGPNGRDERLIPKIEELTTTSATITFTAESIQGVFDDVYAAKLVDGKFTKPKKKAKTKEVLQWDDLETVSVNGKQDKLYIYRSSETFALAPAIKRHLQAEADPWLQLWRRMVWEVLRNNQARAPFDQTAEGKHCSVGSVAWIQLCKALEKRAKSQFETAKISGALMIGAQADNAETVPFQDRVEHNLLLNFWQVVVLTFAPHLVNRKEKKPKRQGYVLTIPDVADLREFCEAFPEILGSLRAEHPDRLPAEARIDLPAQANLEVLRRLKGDEPREQAAVKATRRRASVSTNSVDATTVGAKRALHRDWGGSVRAIESYHVQKAGNNIKMLSFARIADRPGLIDDYKGIIGSFRNPLYRAARLRALVQDQPWHGAMIELFAEYPWPFFLEGDETPRFLPRFGRDAQAQFRAFYEDTYDMTLDEMNDEERLKHLSLIIQRLINKYVEGRAEVKTGKKARDFPKKTIDGKPRRVYPADFREAQQRVCSDAFLAMRSRHDQDFVEYFAGSICSVAQFLPPSDYQFLIQTLMTRPSANPTAQPGLSWQDVKAIAMIAVSACSFQVRPRDAEAQTQGSPS